MSQTASRVITKSRQSINEGSTASASREIDVSEKMSILFCVYVAYVYVVKYFSNYSCNYHRQPVLMACWLSGSLPQVVNLIWLFWICISFQNFKFSLIRFVCSKMWQGKSNLDPRDEHDNKVNNDTNWCHKQRHKIRTHKWHRTYKNF